MPTSAVRDPTPQNLLTLEPRIRALAYHLIVAAREAGIPLIITSARRSFREQIGHVLAGRSWTLTSKHLMGKAFDVDVVGWNRSAIPASWWHALGAYGESLGLKWGGRWRVFDAGHFELP